MKRVLAIVLTFTMVLCALPAMALGNTPVISLELKNPVETISKGDEITVAVKLDEVPGDLFAFDLRIDYPASVLSVTSVTPTAKKRLPGHEPGTER